MRQLIRKNVLVAWCLLTLGFLSSVIRFYFAVWDENTTTRPLFYHGGGIFPGAFILVAGLLTFVRFELNGDQSAAKITAFLIGVWSLVSGLILPLLIADVYGRTNSGVGLLLYAYVSGSFFLYALGHRGNGRVQGNVWAAWVNAQFDRVRNFGFGKTVLLCVTLYGLVTLGRVNFEDHKCKVYCESIGAAKYLFEPAFCDRFNCTEVACTCTTQEELDQSNAIVDKMLERASEKRTERDELP